MKYSASLNVVNWWPMKYSPLPFLAIAIFSCGAHAVHQSNDQRVTGTYEFIICKGACSFSDRANVFATAVVVLFDTVISRAEKERIDPIYHSDPNDVRACYAVIRKVQAPSYVGINNKTGLSPWNLNGKTLQFELFHGIDA